MAVITRARSSRDILNSADGLQQCSTSEKYQIGEKESKEKCYPVVAKLSGTESPLPVISLLSGQIQYRFSQEIRFR